MPKTNLVVIGVKSLEVASWSPGKDGAGVPPTQIHLLLEVPGLDEPLVVRLKSRQVVDELIAALVDHRNEVWPPDRC